MTVTITDNRTLVDAGDSATGWASDSGGSNSLVTTDPEEKESSGHIGKVVSDTEHDLHHVHSSTNLSSGILVYIWAFGQGILNTAVNNGLSAYLGDSAGQSYAYEVAGSDVAVFRHSSGSAVNYQCLLIDTSSLPTGTLKFGSGAIDLTIITKFGINFYTTAKAVGGAINSFVDRITYGNGGLTMNGTETLTVLEEIASRDAGQTSGDSFGIVRDLGGGIFGVQGQLLFGYVSATANETMSIVDQTLKFENFSGVGTDKFGLTFQGNATDTQTFTINNATLFSPIGSGAFLDASDVDVDSFDLINSAIINFDIGIDLCTDATNGPNHDISFNKFTGCSQINIGKTAFANNQIIDSDDTTQGSMIIDSNTSLTNVSDLFFSKDGATLGHAIYITQTGTYTFNNFTYSGYEGISTEATVYNNSGGAVTINVSGGDTPTVRNGASASTNVVSTRTKSIIGGTSGEEEKLALYQSTGVDSLVADKDQFSSHATNNVVTDTTFDITITIPADTPASGTLKLLKKNADGSIAREDSHTYTSFSGVTFSGVSPALAVTYDGSDRAFVPYIEKDITADPETYVYSYVSVRNLVIVWRKKGFLEFKLATTLPDANTSETIVKRLDKTVNLP